MASSVPANLAQYYGARTQASQDESNEKPLQSSDEDDYEHMNPGVIVETDMKSSLNNYRHPSPTKTVTSLSASLNQFRIPSRPPQAQARSSVQYSSIVIPKDSNARPTMAEKPRIASKRNSTPINYTQVAEFYRKPEGMGIAHAQTSTINITLFLCTYRG